MMKNYRISVNGNTYDVSVEEVSEGTSVLPVANNQPVKAVSPTPKKPVQSGAKEGGFKLESPMAGVVVSVPVAVGGSVSKNQAVVLIEAMKMENEIVSPVNGTIATVHVTKGQTVSAGELLITISE